eukprot:TRINITY_DN2377_c0_g2_i1.p1 TRINITY_DN2377_c0_g2~~TRINITY_DN2377_c0_g2_i1.p1  ORF type:complete len:348 (+),score=65.44 TRINITY_DN2377_c0_g2_i1:151-1194(+)
MRVFQKFKTQHQDHIHDLAYDFYGKRIATCSSDQTIKVWDQDESLQWVVTSEWKAHNGSIWKLAWAHPEFGQIIASCSHDRTVCLWEESDLNEKGGPRKWIELTRLVDSRDSMVDVKFAPRHLGLKLATCSLDGNVRIYEATDVMNLTHWPLSEQFDALTQKGGEARCISWNPSPFDRTMIVVGTTEPSVKIWEYNDSQRKWVVVETLIDKLGPEHIVHDVCWAPNMGRTYHLIAAAIRDTVRIWKVKPSPEKSQPEKPHLEVEEVMCRHDHKSEVWRVGFNITGTILASSGDDQNVRLWKTTMGDRWVPFLRASGEDDDEGNQNQDVINKTYKKKNKNKKLQNTKI